MDTPPTNSNSELYGEEERILTVKEFDSEERPREKAAKYGLSSLSNSELLAIVLRTGQPGHPVTEIADELMKSRQNKFTLLERMTDEELMAIHGIGAVKVLEIRTMLEIMRRYTGETLSDLTQIKESKDIYNFMRLRIANLDHEQMWALFLNNNNRIIGEMKVSEGSATATIFDTKKILRRALTVNSQAIVLCHNHPSGVCRPSGPDQQITNKFAEACKTMDFRFLDHLIITIDGDYSFNDNGTLPR